MSTDKGSLIRLMLTLAHIKKGAKDKIAEIADAYPGGIIARVLPRVLRCLLACPWVILQLTGA